MSEFITFIDTSEVLDGKLEELKAAMMELAEFTRVNEPRPLAYNMYFDPDGTRMTVVQVHPDSASMEFHMKVAASLFPRFAEFVKMVAMDIYGKPSSDLLAQMRKKAEMLGSESFLVHELHVGFDRFIPLS